MLGTVFHQPDKLDHIPGAGLAVAAEAAVGIGLGIDLQARCFIRMEGALQPVVPIRPKPIMRQHGFYTQEGLNFSDFHNGTVLAWEAGLRRRWFFLAYPKSFKNLPLQFDYDICIS